MERLFFIVSLTFFVFLYGFFTRHTGIFPSKEIIGAGREARDLLGGSKPHHLFPIVHDREGVTVSDEDGMADGVTLLTSYWPDFDWRAGIRLVDAAGVTLHAWKTDSAEVFAGHSAENLQQDEYVHGTYLFPNGDVIFNIEMRGVARIDACGTVKWALPNRSHHSIALTEDGNFWIAGVEGHFAETAEDRAYVRQFTGLKTPLYEDLLRKISPDGEVLQEISVLKTLYDNGLQRYLAKHNHRAGDVTHLNDIEPLPAALAAQYPLFEAGDLVVSLKFTHLVLVMDPETGKVKWHTSDPIIEQHDPDFTGDGWITIFDNNSDFSARGQMLGGSRIISVRPHTGETEQWYPVEGARPFYTFAGGKWQHLDNGNMLITEARAGRVFEATREGEIVWEWIHTPYDDELIPEVLEATRYAFTPAQIAEWDCSPD